MTDHCSLTSPNVIAALRSRRYGQNRSYLADCVGLGAGFFAPFGRIVLQNLGRQHEDAT